MQRRIYTEPIAIATSAADADVVADRLTHARIPYLREVCARGSGAVTYYVRPADLAAVWRAWGITLINGASNAHHYGQVC